MATRSYELSINELPNKNNYTNVPAWFLMAL
jgi:hypothetical protein